MTDNLCGYRKPKPEIIPANRLPGNRPLVNVHCRMRTPRKRKAQMPPLFNIHPPIVYQLFHIIICAH